MKSVYYTLRIMASVILSLAVFGALAQADDSVFKIGGGGGIKQGSTYSSMLGTIASYCNTDSLTISEVNSSGSTDNLTALQSNKTKAALIQTDVLWAAKQENAPAVAMYQTLVTLHMENVHVIARADTKTEGGWSLSKIGINKTVGGTDVTFNSIDDLRGRHIGAVGGSVRTAQILNDILKLGLVVDTFPANDAMTQALMSHQIDAEIVVAGSPSKVVQALPANQFKLLALRGNSDTSAVYAPTKVQYSNLNGGHAVDTLGVQTLLVSRVFRSPEMVSKLAQLRACIRGNLDKILDGDDVHPAWRTVNADDHGKWDWYNLPVPTSQTQPQASQQKKSTKK